MSSKKTKKEVQEAALEDDYEYFLNYRNSISKFKFVEAKNLNIKEYMGLQDEINRIDEYLNGTQKFLSI